MTPPSGQPAVSEAACLSGLGNLAAFLKIDRQVDMFLLFLTGRQTGFTAADRLCRQFRLPSPAPFLRFDPL